MADWLKLAPSGGPERVQRAREIAQALTDQVPEDRAALEAARVAVVEAERLDREQLAQAMRDGREPVSNTEAIADARERLGVAERRLEARQLAVAAASQELGDAIRACRPEWSRSAEQAAQKAGGRARAALDRLEAELHALAGARAVSWWLETGLDTERRVPHPVLGTAPSSARHAKNDSPLSAQALLDWLRETVDPSPPPTPPLEPQALEPIRFGVYVPQ
jgi:hypothetical protein